MLLIPTVGQMSTVIGVALLLTVVISGAAGYLMARLEQQHTGLTPAGLHDDRIPVSSPVSSSPDAAGTVAMPGQRTAALDNDQAHARR